MIPNVGRKELEKIEMKKIDIATWNRKTHFEFFRRIDLPFYNVNFNLDISGLREFAKLQSVSLNTLLI